MTIEDAFRYRKESAQIQILLRVRTAQVAEWLQCSKLPIVFTPLGSDTEQYRVMWDKDLGSVTQARQRYSHIDGYLGVVSTPKGIGVRFVAKKYQSARASAGLETGEVYTVLGWPLEVAESEVAELLTALKWPAKVIEHSRRVRGRTAQLKVRALTPPPKDVIRLTSGAEIVTLHIVAQQSRVHKPDKPRPEAPLTWSQAVRATLGKQGQEIHTSVGSAGSQHDNAGTSTLRVNWADQEDEGENEYEDDDMGDTDPEEEWYPTSPDVDVTRDAYVEDEVPQSKKRKQALNGRWNRGTIKNASKSGRVKQLEQGFGQS